MAETIVPTEDELRQLARQGSYDGLLDELTLISDLIMGAHHQLARITSLEGDGRRLQMMLLVQSVNAGFSARGLLTDGYPRQALHFARFLREGHIAFRWSSAESSDDAVERHFADFRARKEWPRGTWPQVGTMARSLPERFMASTPYQDFQRGAREVANELFSHAVSDWALDATIEFSDEDGWRAALGPSFRIDLVEEAARALAPLLLWLLVDCAEFAPTVTDGVADRDRIDPLRRRFDDIFGADEDGATLP